MNAKQTAVILQFVKMDFDKRKAAFKFSEFYFIIAVRRLHIDLYAASNECTGGTGNQAFGLVGVKQLLYLPI
jgi:hypothetical protein